MDRRRLPHPHRPPSPRDLEIADLFMSGVARIEISKKFGITRERVRQILEKIGINERYPWLPGIASVQSALADSTSLEDYSNRLKLPTNRAQSAAKLHGLQDEFDQAKRRWRTVKYQAKQLPLIHEIQLLAAELKHTPTTHELRLAGLILGTLNRYFGSVEEAILAAGLRPTPVGKAPAGLPEDFEVSQDALSVIDQYKAKQLEAHTFERQSPLIQKIRALALALGHTPSQQDLFDNGMAFFRIQNAFGSTNKAILASGLLPNRVRHLSPLPIGFADIEIPDIDKILVRKRAGQLRRVQPDLPPPAGNPHPPIMEIGGVKRYVRDPKVVAWVLQNAKGFCELCETQGYEDDNGERFLETHHIVFLSNGGEDSITNVAAVCETCHGKLHRCKDRENLKAALYAKTPRLILSQQPPVAVQANKAQKKAKSVYVPKEPRSTFDELGIPIKYKGRPRKSEIGKSLTKTDELQPAPGMKPLAGVKKSPKPVRPTVDEEGNPLRHRGRPRIGEIVIPRTSRLPRPAVDENGNPIPRRGRKPKSQTTPLETTESVSAEEPIKRP